jgi:hypothetical protein
MLFYESNKEHGTCNDGRRVFMFEEEYHLVSSDTYNSPGIK